MDLNTLPEAKPALEITDLSREALSTSSKWAKFLAIVGFVGCGLMVCIGLFAGSIMSEASETAGSRLSTLGAVGIGILYTVIGLLYFFPCLYLYRFASHTQSALVTNESVILERALDNLKKMFQFVGLMTAILLGIYVLIFIGAIAVGLVAAGS